MHDKLKMRPNCCTHAFPPIEPVCLPWQECRVMKFPGRYCGVRWPLLLALLALVRVVSAAEAPRAKGKRVDFKCIGAILPGHEPGHHARIHRNRLIDHQRDPTAGHALHQERTQHLHMRVPGTDQEQITRTYTREWDVGCGRHKPAILAHPARQI